MASLAGPPEPETPIAAHLARQAAAENRRDIGIAWKVGPAAASLFDAWATQDAIDRGGVEANPLMAPFAHNDLALYGVKLGTGILAGIAAHKLAKAGHPTMAKVVSGLNIAVPLGAGVVNLSGGRGR